MPSVERDTPASVDYREPANVRFASGDAHVRFGEPGRSIQASARRATSSTGDLLAPVRASLLPPDDRTPFAEHEAERLLAHHRLAVDHAIAVRQQRIRAPGHGWYAASIGEVSERLKGTP